MPVPHSEQGCELGSVEFQAGQPPTFQPGALDSTQMKNKLTPDGASLPYVRVVYPMRQPICRKHPLTLTVYLFGHPK